MDHLTQGRRRRHKSPSSLPSAQTMPVPRLADHLDTVDGPSDEEREKDAKRQRSEPTTPISTSSRPPHEYDEVMGITQVEQREAERFEEGVEPEFQDAEEGAIREENDGTDAMTHESGALHGGFGSATLRECLDKMNQRGVDAPAEFSRNIWKIFCSRITRHTRRIKKNCCKTFSGPFESLFPRGTQDPSKSQKILQIYHV